MRPLPLAGVLVGVLVGGCLPTPATQEAARIHDLYRVILVLAIAVAAIVWGLITLAVLRFRRPRRPTHRDGVDGEDRDAIPPQIGGHVGLEALWTLVPLVTIFGIFGLTVLTLDEVERREPSGQVELHVEAFRWGWRMTYPADGVEVVGVREPGPTAVVPYGQPLLVTLTSVDVIHSFYVPQFLYKRDAVPGQERQFELTIEQPGTYAGQCAEFCGLFHARMPFTIQAVDPGEFGAWLVLMREAAASPAAPSP